jgi:hypothetical protein
MAKGLKFTEIDTELLRERCSDPAFIENPPATTSSV